MSRITVTVSGPVGVGKSAVAFRIHESLSGLGVGLTSNASLDGSQADPITATDIDIVERVDYPAARSIFNPRYKRYAAWPVVLWCRLRGHFGQPSWGATNRCLRCGDAR